MPRAKREFSVGPVLPGPPERPAGMTGGTLDYEQLQAEILQENKAVQRYASRTQHLLESWCVQVVQGCGRGFSPWKCALDKQGCCRVTKQQQQQQRDAESFRQQRRSDAEAFTAAVTTLREAEAQLQQVQACSTLFKLLKLHTANADGLLKSSASAHQVWCSPLAICPPGAATAEGQL